MKNTIQTVFAATGSYIPDMIVKNSDFLNHSFFEKNGTPILKDNATVIEKFREIAGIEERRYARPEQRASDLGFLAAKDALESSGIDAETLDYIIVAHNFGDVTYETNRSDMVPTLASRIKHMLGIKNADCVAYDLPFGCPGWVQGVIQADYFIRSGDAKRCMVIGTETLSRVVDPHDRDTMLYSDGGGAVILEASSEETVGILSHKTQTHSLEHAMLLTMHNPVYDCGGEENDIFLTMNGRKLYEFALSNVPLVVKAALDKAGVHLSEIKKVLIHQANDKMDNAILQRLFKLYDIESFDSAEVMPMIISWLGNSSVATVPTLLDIILKNKMPGHHIGKGDKVVFASVGAGMNINAIVYQF
ncbi:3-oxoacyl-ACP synthase III family protein [Mucilaginibacter paludis]|uniref:3-Oxoacyl-(Acyl-carrier-protein (ACP)) synthase III n=1 Tax=Mucilaginibacter paludis DSM 18603 TaxID=714943 RepID=H1Y0C4_9SPHI|nr:ketoacyl-ACP synthase III [Mucilaginibacter paludis]EHQ28173.1 3-Oxoacyl-(acyl-carrier-protein (ACP)) synthase III [Mucilaginibacter paludis DSM 18603]